MKPHFAMLISANRRMEFQAELFIRSLEFYGQVTDYFFDLFILEGETISSEYLRAKTNIVHYKSALPYGYTNPWTITPRWDMEPKSDLCIHVDADILIVSNLQKLFDYCKEPGLYGCIANTPPFSLSKWKAALAMFGLALPERMYLYKQCCGNFQAPKETSVCPFYPNNGFLVTHAKYVPRIREEFKRVLATLNDRYRENVYHPQFSLAIALQILQVPTHVLPNSFNYVTTFNYKTPLIYEDIVYHYDWNATCLGDLQDNPLVYKAVRKLFKQSVKLC